jgi:hypothetical protein
MRYTNIVSARCHRVDATIPLEDLHIGVAHGLEREDIWMQKFTTHNPGLLMHAHAVKAGRGGTAH